MFKNTYSCLSGKPEWSDTISDSVIDVRIGKIVDFKMISTVSMKIILLIKNY